MPSAFVRWCCLLHWLENRSIHSVLFPLYAQIKGKTEPVIFTRCCQGPVATCQHYGLLVIMDKWKTEGIPLTYAFCLSGPWLFIGPVALISAETSLALECEWILKISTEKSDFRDVEIRAQRGRFPCTDAPKGSGRAGNSSSISSPVLHPQCHIASFSLPSSAVWPFLVPVESQL